MSPDQVRGANDKSVTFGHTTKSINATGRLRLHWLESRGTHQKSRSSQLSVSKALDTSQIYKLYRPWAGIKN